MRFTILGCLMLAGCAVANVTAHSPDSVSVAYNGGATPPEMIQAKADAECARYGKRAVRITPPGPGLNIEIARFDCVPAASGPRR